MKIRWLSIIMSLLLIITVIGCTAKELKQEDDENQSLNINIETPIVFSQNKVNLADGSTVYVNVEMIEGRYYFDEAAGAFTGNNWNGSFQIRVYTNEFDFNSTVSLMPISFYDNQEMNFKNEFSLTFEDYNNDGNPDFTLGQYSSSNGYEYVLFSINQEGQIEKLDTGGVMFISEHDYSIKLEKLSPISFKKSAYDNSIGKTVESIYQWKDDKFIAED